MHALKSRKMTGNTTRNTSSTWQTHRIWTLGTWLGTPPGTHHQQDKNHELSTRNMTGNTTRNTSPSWQTNMIWKQGPWLGTPAGTHRQPGNYTWVEGTPPGTHRQPDKYTWVEHTEHDWEHHQKHIVKMKNTHDLNTRNMIHDCEDHHKHVVNLISTYEFILLRGVQPMLSTHTTGYLIKCYKCVFFISVNKI
jgi:hypothetical protein